MYQSAALYLISCLFLFSACGKEQVRSSSESCDRSKLKLKESLEISVDDLKIAGVNQIIVPARTEYVVWFDSYCMNSGAAGPSKNEGYELVLHKAKSPVVKLLDGIWQKPMKKYLVQSLIWNLTRGRHPRDLPRRQREILAGVGVADPADVEVLEIEEFMFDISSTVFGELVVSTLENYNVTQSAILRRKSQQAQQPNRQRKSCAYPFLVELRETQGYQRSKVALYNASDQEASYKLTRYHFKPFRKDVQPLAIELKRTEEKAEKPSQLR